MDCVAGLLWDVGPRGLLGIVETWGPQRCSGAGSNPGEEPRRGLKHQVPAGAMLCLIAAKPGENTQLPPPSCRQAPRSRGDNRAPLSPCPRLANKQDSASALLPCELIERLALERLVNENRSPCRIVSARLPRSPLLAPRRG